MNQLIEIVLIRNTPTLWSFLEEVAEWCFDNLKPGWKLKPGWEISDPYPFSAFVVDESDAMLFKLRWLGE
jgi:hypothetical protein